MIVLDCGLHVKDSGLQVLDSSLFQWNLDSQFQLIVGVRILWAVLRPPKPRIPDFTCKFFQDSGFRYMARYKGWTITKVKGLGWIFGRSLKVFSLHLRWKSIFPPRTAFLIMVRVEILFLLMRLPSANLLSFFSNGDIPNIKVTRPSFFGGYHPTLKFSGIPTFAFIVSLTHRMDNI